MSLSYSVTNVHLHWRRTKIIATLGPASHTPDIIGQLIDQGANIFRLNMSHGTHEQHQLMVKNIRQVAADKQQHIAILMDLCGPKIRVGTFETGSITLKVGEPLVVSCEAMSGKAGLIVSQYKNLYRDVNIGERILLDDGKLELKVLSIKDKEVHCDVIYGGVLSNNKGLNLPDSKVSITSFTDKDKRDAQLAINLEVDYLALSFVRDQHCVTTLKQFIIQLGVDIPIIAKIEKPEAVKNIDDILTVADGIMIARGDLGIEMPAQQVPLIQKVLINKARCYGKPVIVATQMLESMITSSKPTRAEVSDVATATLSGTDAVMLSAETACGDFPVLAVDTMDDILREIEAYQYHYDQFSSSDFDATEIIHSERQAIANAVTSLAHELKLQGIFVPTTSGTTAQVLSSDRPSAPLIGVSSNKRVCRKLALSWGVIPIHVEEKHIGDWQTLCNKVSTICCLMETGNRVLLVSGFNNDPELNQPVIKLLKVNTD